MKSFVDLQPFSSSTSNTLFSRVRNHLSTLLFQFYTSSILQYYPYHRINDFKIIMISDFSSTRVSNKSNSRQDSKEEMFYNKSIHIKRSKLGARFGNFRFHSRACVKTFLGKSAFRKRRRQFFRGYYAPVPIPGPPFSSFDQGCAWIFDRRARPQWEICTAKRITDVFVRLVTMGGEVDSSRFLDSG